MASVGFPISVLFLMCFSFWFTLIPPACSLTCTSQKFINNAIYPSCVDLPYLTSYLHWDYDSKNSTLSIAFVCPPSKPDGWISWAINPTKTGMEGSQAFIAFKSKGVMTVNTYNISSYMSIVPSKLSFEVWDMKAEESDGTMKIFSKVKVPVNADKLHQVWQVGPSVTDGRPDKHEFQNSNLNAKGVLNFKQTGGQSISSGGGVDSRTKRKNIHGVLNAVSWGILFPLGIIMARYLRTFPSADPAWFYLHAFCQISAYAIGVAGWATGLKLGSESKGIVYTTHRNIGIALFCLVTVQIFALFIRPKKEHKFRFYWNIYHHGIGYSIIILGILNVFKGVDILNPEKKWKSAYVGVLIVLGGIASLLEVITWIIVMRRKSSESAKHYNGYNNGSRQQPLAI